MKTYKLLDSMILAPKGGRNLGEVDRRFDVLSGYVRQSIKVTSVKEETVNADSPLFISPLCSRFNCSLRPTGIEWEILQNVYLRGLLIYQ